MTVDAWRESLKTVFLLAANELEQLYLTHHTKFGLQFKLTYNPSMRLIAFLEKLSIVIPFLVIGYWTRYEPDGMWQTLMETHQSNFDDIEEQEKKLLEKLVEQLKNNLNVRINQSHLY